MYFDGSVSIHSDVSVVLGIDADVGNAGSCGEQFAAADSLIKISVATNFPYVTSFAAVPIG